MSFFLLRHFVHDIFASGLYNGGNKTKRRPITMAEKKKKHKTEEDGRLTLLENINQQMKLSACFCPNGIVPSNMVYSTDSDAVQKILEQAGWTNPKVPPLDKDLQKELKNQCQVIQDEIQGGDSGQSLVALDRGRLLINNKSYELGNVLLKVITLDFTQPPVYILVRKGDLLKIRVYLSYKHPCGVLVLADSENREIFIRLADCVLLSFNKSNLQEEVGLMLSFVLPDQQVHFSVIKGWSLDPIRHLMMEELLTMERRKTEQSNLPTVSPLGLEGTRHG